MTFALGFLCGGALIYRIAFWVIRGKEADHRTELQEWKDRLGLAAFTNKVLRHELDERATFRTIEQQAIDQLLEETRGEN